jgi:hypothetical protein
MFSRKTDSLDALLADERCTVAKISRWECGTRAEHPRLGGPYTSEECFEASVANTDGGVQVSLIKLY